MFWKLGYHKYSFTLWAAKVLLLNMTEIIWKNVTEVKLHFYTQANLSCFMPQTNLANNVAKITANVTVTQQTPRDIKHTIMTSIIQLPRFQDETLILQKKNVYFTPRGQFDRSS